MRKGVLPYDWFDSFDKLNAIELPPKEAFCSKLTDEHISDDDYAHAQKVWQTFNMKSMRDNHDLYMLVLNATTFVGGSYLAKYLSGNDAKDVLYEKQRHDKALEKKPERLRCLSREEVKVP